ncbi:MAG: restriction endonuclease subunit S [Candidatus Eisenbacteria bacterium]|uniref:Restriction endonuclease subunit S n=1 Tax=Eiseniibacteriota bacterium TaxID=2212470 RepID=A0A937XA14_UNCEI|nr:restriction endonuclease subunit S [Candidatus Eisenbacteria bacterium]
MAMTSHHAPESGPRRFKPYPVYKDSGVEWLGEIPAHWDPLKLKRVCTFAYGDSLASEARVDGDVEVYGSNGLVGSHERANTLAPCLVIGRKGSFGKVNFSPRPVFAIDTTFFVDRRFTRADIRWFYYVLTNARLDSATKDSAIPGLDREDAYVRDVCLCSPDEQRAIAAFLDRETARLDALVAKKERLIELLQEKRTALITRAVTKGLDPTVPMKDSGVEWLGEIPAAWGLKRLKRIVQFRGGGTPTKDNLEYWCGEIPWVSPKDMKVSVVLDTEDKITAQAVHDSATKPVPAGVVLLVVRSGILARSIPVALTGREVTLNQDLKALVPSHELVPEYLMYLISGMQRELLVEWKKEGATVESLELELVANTPTPLPATAEQRAIAAFLDRETARIDALVAKVRDAIDRLRELRTALISAAVTGKIDVRE